MGGSSSTEIDQSGCCRMNCFMDNHLIAISPPAFTLPPSQFPRIHIAFAGAEEGQPSLCVCVCEHTPKNTAGS